MIGKVLKIDDQRRRQFTLSEINADVGGGFFFARFFHLEDDDQSEPLPYGHVISLAIMAELSQAERLIVFDSLEAFHLHYDDKPAAKPGHKTGKAMVQ
jgi:hypothetical protein